MRILIAALLALALSACAGTATRNASLYEAQLNAVRQQQADRDLRQAAMLEGLKNLGDKCESDVCRVSAANSATVAVLAGSMGGNQAQPLPAPPYERDAGSQARDWFTGAAAIVVPGFQYLSAQSQARYANDTAKAQYGYLDHVLTTAVTGSRDVGIAAVGAVPTINVGGDYVTGTQTIAGRDLNSGTQTTTTTTTTVGGDQVGHDKTDRHDVLTNCIAGDGGLGGNSGDPNAGGASGAGGAGAAGGAACH